MWSLLFKTLEETRKALSRFFGRCLFCDKRMLHTSYLVELDTAEGKTLYPSCESCFVEYIKMTAEAARDEKDEESEQ